MRATTPEIEEIYKVVGPWCDKSRKQALAEGKDMFKVKFPDPTWPEEIQEMYRLFKKLSWELKEKLM